MRFPRCMADGGDRGRGRSVCSGIAATTRRRFGADCGRIVRWLAMRRTAHGSGLGRWRWVVERTCAWLNQFRRLRVRYDKRADIHEAPLTGVRADLLAVAAQDLEDRLIWEPRSPWSPIRMDAKSRGAASNPNPFSGPPKTPTHD